MQNTAACSAHVSRPRAFHAMCAGIALALLALQPADAHVIPAGDTDYELFRSCFGQTPSGICGPMDMNGDNLISIWDYLLLRQVVAYDLSGDLIVDYHDSPDNADLNIFRDCYRQPPTGTCAAADFNKDGAINVLDLGLFRSGLKADFNGDLLVDLRSRDNHPPYIEHLYNAARFGLPKKSKFGLYFMAVDFDRDAVSYSYDRGRLPENAKFRSVVYGDVNGDGNVDQTDLDLIDASMGDYNPRLDLDNSHTIDQRDHDLALAWVGRGREVIFFSWKPEDDQVGSYTLRLTAADEHGDSASAGVTLEVSEPAGPAK